MNYFNVLPVLYQHENTLFFTPLFRIRRHPNDKPIFVDSKGRTYRDFRDWEETNVLPEMCEFIYPTNGVLNGSNTSKKLKINSKDKGFNKVIGDTLKLADGIIPFKGALEAPMAFVDAFNDFNDRRLHGESINPLTSGESAGIIVKALAKPFQSMFNLKASMTFSKKEAKSEKVSR